MSFNHFALVTISIALLQACSSPQDEPKPEASTSATATENGMADYAKPAAPVTEVFFGDTHLHTALSIDAGTFGNRLGLDEAYRFTRGEVVETSHGLQAQLRRPLDFVVIADHSDGMGVFQLIESKDPALMQYEQPARWAAMLEEGKRTEAASDLITNVSQNTLDFNPNDPQLAGPVWESVVAAAEKYNDPGKFTALIGYEWTSLVKGNNLHRVVVYRDNGDKAIQRLPFTMLSSPDPEELWEELATYEEQTGGKVLAIPHNGNLSNGMMFDVETLSGGEITLDYAERRQRWEPLYETTQIKGDGETHSHALLSPDDEFADYETWDMGNLDNSELKTPEMLPGEYARSGLKRGLEFEEKFGVNPYKFGQIGSTDSHTSLPTAEEDNFYGKHSGVEPEPERWNHVVIAGVEKNVYGWQMASSGYAAVWAKENTREAIWDAMMRRETYATTGTRPKLRFFGGFNFDGSESADDLYAADGYAKGVPMGSDLPPVTGKAPTFLIAAEMDETSGNLDRLQVVKGWVDKTGVAQERVYDVAVSDGREIGQDGRCVESVGNTVDIVTATWSNSIGAPKLNAVWTDPDFNPTHRAFYYVRLLEIPTPRWTAYEADRFRVQMGKEVPMFGQERAYSSPIWYTP